MPKIIYEDIPLKANEGAVLTSERVQPFSDMNLLTEGFEIVPIASLENNYWRLDGRFSLLEAGEQYGFYSTEVADENGSFTENPTITVQLDDVYSSTGLTVVFDEAVGEYPKEIKLRWYNGTNLIHEKTFTVTASSYTAICSVEGYTKIVFEVTAGAPGRMVKINKFSIGQVITFNDDELTKVNIIDDVDPIAAELSVGTLEFNIHDRQQRDFIFQQRQRFKVYQNDELQGIFYFESVNRTANRSYELKATTVVGVLEQSDFMGGMYDGISAQQLVGDVLGDSFGFELASAFSQTVLSGYLPISTKREALAQIAFAIGAVIVTYGSENIRFIPMPTVSHGTIINENIFYGGAVKRDSILSQVSVCSHSYEAGSEDKEVFKGVVNGQSRTTFSQPYTNYQITGGEIVQSGVNYVDFIGTGQQVIIRATPYNHYTQVYTKRNPLASLNNNDNTYQVEKATLVNDGNANEVLERVYGFYLNRERLEQTIVVKGQQPGQFITSVKPFGGNIKGFITKMSTRYSSKHKIADIEIFGSRVDLPAVWLYSGQEVSGGHAVYYRQNT